MNYEEFKKDFLNVIQDPDTMITKADDLLNVIQEVYNNNESYKEQIKTLENKNNDLRDANIKLLMREAHVLTEEQPKRTAEQAKQDLLQIIKGGK